MPNLITTVWGGNRKPILVQDYGDGQPIDTRISFTRATPATLFDVAGVLQTAASGVARVNSYVFDGTNWINRGFLIEETRINICLQSEDFATTWGGTNVTVDTDVIAAPDGNTTADKIVEKDLTAVTYARIQSVTVDNTTVYTFSCFAKKNERAFFMLFNATISQGKFFDIDNVAVLGNFMNAPDNATIEDVDNGWVRGSITFTTTTTTADVRVYISPDGTTFGYDGDSTKGLHAWGAQLEKGLRATSYIPTTTTSVTRNIDVPFILTADIPGWVDGGPITILTESFKQVIGATSDPLIVIDDGSDNDKIVVDSPESGADKTDYLTVNSTGGTNDASIINVGTAWIAGDSKKTAIALATNDTELVQDGASLGTDASVDIPTGLTHFRIGADFSGNSYNGYIKTHKIFKGRLPSGTLTYETGDH